MVDSYHIFARCMFFNPEMSGTYRSNIDKYMGYFSSVVRNIDIYLQEDQLMHTKCGFPLVPIPHISTQIYPTSGRQPLRQDNTWYNNNFNYRGQQPYAWFDERYN